MLYTEYISLYSRILNVKLDREWHTPPNKIYSASSEIFGFLCYGKYTQKNQGKGILDFLVHLLIMLAKDMNLKTACLVHRSLEKHLLSLIGLWVEDKDLQLLYRWCLSLILSLNLI